MTASRRSLQCLLAACFLSAVTARQLLLAVNCDLEKERCDAISCKGKIKFECDATTNKVECLCESAGLASCFPGSATVAIPGGGAKQLSQLALGDRVLAVGAGGRLQYSPVYMFSSQRPAQLAPFLRVRTDRGLNITVTPGHYMFAWSSAAAAAAQAALKAPASWPYVLPTQLAPGDLVPVVRAGSSGGPELARVTAVEEIVDVGVFMPHTLTGAIVVDGVVASELTSIVPPALAGPTLQRGMAAALRMAFAVLPAGAVEAAVKGVSTWVHGTADASISYQGLVAAASPAA